METYDQMLDRLAQSSSPDVINNSSVQHAASLVRAMFTYAKDSVVIFTGALNPAAYGTQAVKEAAANFLNRNGSIRVVIQDDADKASTKDLKSKGLLPYLESEHLFDDRSIQIHRASPALKDIGMHFLVMDGHAYRLEPDKNKPVAIASFNNTKTSSMLLSVFNEIWKRSEPIDFQFAPATAE